MDKRHCDVAIIGGGLAGALLLHCLDALDFDVLMIEQKDLKVSKTAPLDARTLALSNASINVFKALGIWAKIESLTNPIDVVQVSERGRFGKACIERDVDKALGAVIPAQDLADVLFGLLPKKRVIAPASLVSIEKKTATLNIQTPNGLLAVDAKLVIGADGTHSKLRDLLGWQHETRYFEHGALVCNVLLKRHHRNQAFERFTDTGPMALLPMQGNQAALIWCLPSNRAKQIKELPKAAFLRALQTDFGYRAGRFLDVGARAYYPLSQGSMPKQAAWPYLFIGNAAHTLHPVAGQGFNLSLRDIAMLVQSLMQYGLKPEALEQYLESRRADQKNIMRLTNTLVDVFTFKAPGAGLIRGLSLLAFDQLPFLKDWFGRQASGFGGDTQSFLTSGMPISLAEEFFGV